MSLKRATGSLNEQWEARLSLNELGCDYHSERQRRLGSDCVAEVSYKMYGRAAPCTEWLKLATSSLASCTWDSDCVAHSSYTAPRMSEDVASAVEARENVNGRERHRRV